MTKEKISIVVPVYNSENYLSECLDSLLSQTYDNIEIIAINDGSTDNSLQILEKFSSKISIINQKNSGLAVSLMNGVKYHTGTWFKWFSPDDILHPTFLDTIMNNINKNSSDTIFYTNWDMIDEHGNHIRNFTESNYNNLSNFDFTIRLLDGQQINVNTTLIPSKLFEQGCVFRDLDDLVAIDYDFFLKASIFHNVKFNLINSRLVSYRIHSGQLSHMNIIKSLKYVQTIKQQILSELPSSEQIKYKNALKAYRKSKSVKNKAMDLGLKLLSETPSWTSDKLLTYYLEKIRRSR